MLEAARPFLEALLVGMLFPQVKNIAYYKNSNFPQHATQQGLLYFPLWMNRHLTCWQCLHHRREYATWGTTESMFIVMSEHVTRHSIAGHRQFLDCCSTQPSAYTMMENSPWTSDVNTKGASHFCWFCLCCHNFYFSFMDFHKVFCIVVWMNY